jgi:hypothetical protein
MKRSKLMGSICAVLSAGLLWTGSAAAWDGGPRLVDGIDVIAADVIAEGIAIQLTATEVAGPGRLVLRDLGGAPLAEADFDLAPGDNPPTILPLPAEVAGIGRNLRLDLEMAGERRVRGLGLTSACSFDDMPPEDPEIAANLRCEQRAEITNTVSGALPLSDRARTTLEDVRGGDGAGLLDALRFVDAEVVGQILQFTDVVVEEVEEGGCGCAWTVTNQDGLKDPAWALFGNETWDKDYLHFDHKTGAGAVLYARLRHERHRGSTKRRNANKSTAGATTQQLQLDCYRVVAIKRVTVEIIQGGVVVKRVVTESPIFGDEPCDECGAQVDWMAMGNVDASASADRVGTSWTEGRADAWLSANVNGQSIFGLHAGAFARDCFGCGADSDADMDTDVRAGSSGAPFNIHFAADTTLSVSGDGKDKARAEAAASYAYAFTARAACGATDIVGFDAGSYVGWQPHYCHEIEDFLGQRGFSVDCD